MELIEIIKEPAAWLLSGIMAMSWSILANFLTPRVQVWYENFREPKLKKDVKKANEFKFAVIRLEGSAASRVEQRLNGIQKYLLSITFILISFVLMWLSTSLEPFFALVISSVFVFYLGISQADKGAKEFFEAKLAEQRATEMLKFESEAEKKFNGKDTEQFRKAKAAKLKEMNIRDFHIE